MSHHAASPKETTMSTPKVFTIQGGPDDHPIEVTQCTGATVRLRQLHYGTDAPQEVDVSYLQIEELFDAMKFARGWSETAARDAVMAWRAQHPGDCAVCGGSGKQTVAPRYDGSVGEFKRKCQSCHGTGKARHL
jgi:hypothetical protein